jgi:sugar phosphate isomerase/epimerase
MIRVGAGFYATGVVHNAAYAGIAHDQIASVRSLALRPELDCIEAVWPQDGAERAPLRQLLSDAGVLCVHAAGGQMRRQSIDPHSEDPEERTRGMQRLKLMVEAASDMGARMIVLCSGPDPAPERRDSAKTQLVAALQELCLHAQDLRSEDPLWISFEHFDRHLDQKRLLGPTQETVEVIRRVRRHSPNIGILADLSHIVQLGEPIDEAIDTIGDLLIHAHVANCGIDPNYPDVFGDSHCRFGDPGSAVTLSEVTVFLAALERNGYSRRVLPTGHALISVEMKTPPEGDPGMSIANGLRMLAQAAAMVTALD